MVPGDTAEAPIDVKVAIKYLGIHTVVVYPSSGRSEETIRSEDIQQRGCRNAGSAYDKVCSDGEFMAIAIIGCMDRRLNPFFERSSGTRRCVTPPTEKVYIIRDAGGGAPTP